MADQESVTENGVEPQQQPTRQRRAWRLLKQFGTHAVAILAGIPAAIVAIWIVVSVLILTFRHHDLDLELIGVPEILNKSGFTSEVATERLRDAILKVQDLTDTVARKTAVEAAQDLSGITIPRTDLSLSGAANFLRGVFPGWQNRITGEFTQSGDELSLQLRLNGRRIFEGIAASAAPDAADKLIGYGVAGGGAFEVVQAIQPYIAAVFLADIGNLVEADQVLDDIFRQLSPRDDQNAVWAHNLKGWVYRDQHQPDAAIAEFQKAIQLDPKLAPAHNGLGNIYRDQNKLDVAIAEYQKTIQLDPKFALSHYNLANIYYDQQQPDAAIAEYQKAIELDPKLAPAHNGLGNVYYGQHKLDVAIAEYQKAIQLDPKFAMSHYNLGNIYRDQHRPDVAIVEYQKAIELDPEYPMAHYNLGIVYYDQQKPDAAIAEFQRGIELAPKDARAHYNLGMAYYYQGKLDAAIPELQRAIELDPKDQTARYNLGIIYRDQRKLGEACKMFIAGGQLAPDNPDYAARSQEVDQMMNGEGHCRP